MAADAAPAAGPGGAPRPTRTVRVLQVLLVVVVGAYVLATLPGVRSGPADDPLVDGWLRDGGYVLAALLVGWRAATVAANRRVWAFVAASLACRAVAFVVFRLHVREQEPVPYPSIADVGWVLAAVLLLVALLQLSRSAGTRWTTSVALDATLGAVAITALVDTWLDDVLLAVRAPGTSADAVLVNLAYPILDLALLVAVVGVIAAFRWRPPRAVWWLGGGVLGLATLDSIFLYQVTTGTFRPGGPLSALSLAATAVLAWASWVPAHQRPVRRAASPDLVAPIGFGTLCLGLLVYATERAVPDLAVVLVTVGLLLVIVRAALAYRLARSVARIEQTLELAQVGDLRSDLRGDRHDWSASTFAILGLDPGTVPGPATLHAAIPPDELRQVVDAEEVAARTGRLDVTHRVVRPDGETRVVQRRSRLEHDVDGGVIGWAGTIQDVTEQHREAEERLQLLRRSVASADDERTRIAEHLHDDAVQLLTAAILRLDLVGGDPAETERVHQPLDEALGVLRTAIAELAPPDLRADTFAAALRDHADRLFPPDARSVRVSACLDGPVDLPDEVLSVGYRITQEALSNARRHAQATRVEVTVEQRDGLLVGTVVDDGVGIAPEAFAEAAFRPGHLGLRLMRERAEAVGGSVTVEPRSDGPGTVVRWQLTLPRR